MATNEQVIERMDQLEESIMPIVRKNEQRLDGLEPMVRNHQFILYGDPEDRKDQGMIGVLNKIDALVDTVGSFVKPIALSMLGAFIMWAVKTGVDIFLTLELLK